MTLNPTAADKRRRDLAAIHAAAAKLGMDTADRNPGSEYRTMLQAQGGATSAADLTADGRRRVLAYLQRLHNPAGRPKRTESQQEHIERRWRQLGEAGAINDASPESLARFVKRLAGVDNLRWITAMQGAKIIEALKAMQARHAAAHRA